MELAGEIEPKLLTFTFLFTGVVFLSSYIRKQRNQLTVVDDDEKRSETGSSISYNPNLYYADAPLPKELHQKDEVVDYYCGNKELFQEEKATKVDDKDKGTPDDWVNRHSELVRLTGRHPFNCEPPLPKLMSKGFITPGALHYVRNHGCAPNIKWDEHRMYIGGLALKPLTLTMTDICALPRKSLPVTLVCCGNRRKEQNMIKQTIGFNWGAAGVGNSVWSGPTLIDVLALAGITKLSDYPPGMHVRFGSEPESGGDKLPNGVYGTSVPLSKALDPANDIIVAYMCNGHLLPTDHGYPVRVIIPGYVGGRMIKWLTHIDLLATESQDYYHFYDNRVFPPHVDADLAKSEDWWHRPEYITNELSVNSAMASPAHEQTLQVLPKDEAMFTVSGYAYAGGGRKIHRVEISLDCGWTWTLSDILVTERPNMYSKYWCWIFWSVDIPVTALADPKVAEVCVRAFDEGFNSQPCKPSWNLMGMLNNPWFRVKVHRSPGSAKGPDGAIVLRFEHPTLAGTAPGGWMVKDKESPMLTHPDAYNPHHSSSDSQVKNVVVAAKGPAVVDVRNLKVNDKLPSYTLAQIVTLGGGTGDDDRPSWIVVSDKVYDCTPFLKDHPGGADSITMNAGIDCTEDFEAVHSNKAWKMLADYYIGNVKHVSNEYDNDTAVVEADVMLNGRVVALNPKKRIPFTLTERVVLSPDSLLLRFALQSKEHVLGLPVGQHMLFYAKVDGKLTARAYTPTSSDHDIGHFDLVIKVYSPCTAFPLGGTMSQYLGAMKVGDAIDVKGPMGHVTYNGKGELALKHGTELVHHRVKTFACFAAGTGITPIYQFIKAILRDKDDKTEITMIYANRKQEDILLKDELDVMIKAHPNRLRVQYVLSMATDKKAWESTGGVCGRVTDLMVKRCVPNGGGDNKAVALLCGPDGFVHDACTNALLAHGYSKDLCIYF